MNNAFRCRTGRAGSVLITAALLFAVRTSHAQNSPAPTAPPPPPAPAPASPSVPGAAEGAPAPTAAQNEEARQRYKRALELFDEGSFDAAQLEMRRAYELAPSFRMLYNLGLISVQLNDYAAALDFFQRYLAEGGKEVPPERVTEVEDRMEKLRGRVAFLRIDTNKPAEVTVDDVVVGQTPLAKPVRVNAGKRRVGARASGLIPDSKVIEVAGGDRVDVSLVLVDPKVTSTVVVQESPSRPEVWATWGAAGVFAGGAIVFGILASNANSDYKNSQNTLGVTSGQLKDADRKVSNLALATDLCGAAAIVAAGAGVYFTFFAKPESSARTSSPPPPPPSARLRLGPGTIQAVGTF